MVPIKKAPHWLIVECKAALATVTRRDGRWLLTWRTNPVTWRSDVALALLVPSHRRFVCRVRDVLSRAGEGWLKNTEVCDLLVHFRTYGLPICRHPPSKPAGALVLLDASRSLQASIWSHSLIKAVSGGARCPQPFGFVGIASYWPAAARSSGFYSLSHVHASTERAISSLELTCQFAL